MVQEDIKRKLNTPVKKFNGMKVKFLIYTEPRYGVKFKLRLTMIQ